jgi:hypothetical protein
MKDTHCSHIIILNFHDLEWTSIRRRFEIEALTFQGDTFSRYLLIPLEIFSLQVASTKVQY